MNFVIPTFKTINMTEKQYEDSIRGVYRFDSAKYRDVVLSTPDVPDEIKKIIVKTVTLYASHPDGSIDVMKSGYILGSMLRDLTDDPDGYACVESVGKWVNNLDRLPMYNVEDSHEAEVRG